jgi:hypothetical protein
MLMPPTRSPSADDHHCSDSSGSNHACDTDASHEEHTSRQSTLYKRQQSTITNTPMPPPKRATQPTITTARVAAINYRAQADALTEDSNRRQSPLHKLQQSTLVNRLMRWQPSLVKLMPPTCKPINDHHCKHSSNHHKHTDAPTNEEPTRRRPPLHERQQLITVNKPMPSPRRATANNHHFTSCSNQSL